MIGIGISPFGLFRPRASFSAEALALFSKWDALGTPASASRKILVDDTIVALKSTGVWNDLDFLYVWTAHSQAASLVDWKNPTTRSATANGNLTFTVDSYWQGGTTGRMDLGYNPGDGGTYNLTQNDNSFGIYTLDRVVENKIDISAQSAGSVGNDILLTNSINAKNVCGTNRSVGVLTGYGLASTHRTASNAWRAYRNGYDLYGGVASPTDASNSITNLGWMEFCRNVNGTYSSFSTKKHCFSFAGANLSARDLSYSIEKYFLDPLGLIPRKRITFNGNSFTSNPIYSAKVLSLLPTYAYDVNKVGVTGQTTVQMQTNATTTVFPYTKTFLTKDVYFIWELTNDLVSTGNATTSYNNMVAYCQALRVAQPSAIIIVATCMPRTNITPDTLRQNDADLTDATTLNGKIRNNADNAWDYVCDTASDLTMGQAGQYSDLTYYDVDGIHPTTVGYEYLATNYIYPSINAVL